MPSFTSTVSGADAGAVAAVPASKTSRTPFESAMETIVTLFMNASAISSAPGNRPPLLFRRSSTNASAPPRTPSSIAAFTFAPES